MPFLLNFLVFIIHYQPDIYVSLTHMGYGPLDRCFPMSLVQCPMSKVQGEDLASSQNVNV
jgi:hypothetical protein